MDAGRKLVGRRADRVGRDEPQRGTAHDSPDHASALRPDSTRAGRDGATVKLGGLSLGTPSNTTFSHYQMSVIRAFYIASAGEPERAVGGKTKREAKDRPLESQTIRPGAFVGIIEPKLFEDVVQNMIARNTARGYKPHADAGCPLTGILVCGRCGGSVVAKRKGRSVSYYCQRASSQPGGGCSLWPAR